VQTAEIPSSLNPNSIDQVEEEEITSDTAAALDRARVSLAPLEGIPHEGILREFGLGK
jgi:hypothetical protein